MVRALSNRSQALADISNYNHNNINHNHSYNGHSHHQMTNNMHNNGHMNNSNILPPPPKNYAAAAAAQNQQQHQQYNNHNSEDNHNHSYYNNNVNLNLNNNNVNSQNQNNWTNSSGNCLSNPGGPGGPGGHPRHAWSNTNTVASNISIPSKIVQNNHHQNNQMNNSNMNINQQQQAQQQQHNNYNNMNNVGPPLPNIPDHGQNQSWGRGGGNNNHPNHNQNQSMNQNQGSHQGPHQVSNTQTHPRTSSNVSTNSGGLHSSSVSNQSGHSSGPAVSNGTGYDHNNMNSNIQHNHNCHNNSNVGNPGPLNVQQCHSQQQQVHVQNNHHHNHNSNMNQHHQMQHHNVPMQGPGPNSQSNNHNQMMQNHNHSIQQHNHNSQNQMHNNQGQQQSMQHHNNQIHHPGPANANIPQHPSQCHQSINEMNPIGGVPHNHHPPHPPSSHNNSQQISTTSSSALLNPNCAGPLQPLQQCRPLDSTLDINTTPPFTLHHLPNIKNLDMVPPLSTPVLGPPSESGGSSSSSSSAAAGPSQTGTETGTSGNNSNFQNNINNSVGNNSQWMQVQQQPNPQWAPGYTSAICDYLQRKERSREMRIHPNFLSDHIEVNPRMRGILLDWLVEVHYKFKLLAETLYLCFNLIDRYLQVDKRIEKKRLQLLGGTCIFIASKYEEYRPPEVRDICYIMDNAYSKAEVLEMEVQVLNTLKFELTTASPLQFLNLFIHNVCLQDGQLHLLSQFCLECFLLDYHLVSYLPSQMAAVALCVASRIMHPSTVAQQTGPNAITNSNEGGQVTGTVAGTGAAAVNGAVTSTSSSSSDPSSSAPPPVASITPGYSWYGEAQMESIKDELLRAIAGQKDRALGKKYSKERYKEVIRYIRQFE